MGASKQLFTQEQQRIWDEMTPAEQMATLEGYKWCLHNTKERQIEIISEVFGNYR